MVITNPKPEREPRSFWGMNPSLEGVAVGGLGRSQEKFENLNFGFEAIKEFRI